MSSRDLPSGDGETAWHLDELRRRSTRRDCLQLGLGALLGGGLAHALRARGAGEPAARPRRPRAASSSGWTAGRPTSRRSTPSRTPRPRSAASSSRSPPTVPGRPLLRAHDAAGGDRRQVRRRPLDPPRPGQPRGRQPLHDDRRPAAHPGRLRRVRQLPPEPGLGRPPHEQRRPAGLPAYFSHAEMSRSGGPNFLGAKYAPFVVADDPNSADFRVRDVALPRGLTGERFARPRATCAPRSTASSGSLDKAAGDPALALDEHYQQALRPDALEGGPGGVRHRPRAGRASATRYGRNAVRPAGPARPAAGRGRRAVHHALRRRLGPPRRALRRAARSGCRRWDQRRRGADRRPRPARPARHDAGDRPGRVRPHAADQQGRRPRPLVERHVACCSPAAARPGGQVVGATDRKGYAAVERVLSPENFASTVYTQARHRPRQDPLHPATAGRRTWSATRRRSGN